jgi:hypothetical protein
VSSLRNKISDLAGHTGTFKCIVRVWPNKKPIWDARERFDHAVTPTSYGNFKLPNLVENPRSRGIEIPAGQMIPVYLLFRKVC